MKKRMLTLMTVAALTMAACGSAQSGDDSASTAKPTQGMEAVTNQTTTNQAEEEETTFESEATDFSEVDTSEFWYEQQDDGTIIITGLMGELEEVVIPKAIDGMKVPKVQSLR